MAIDSFTPVNEKEYTKVNVKIGGDDLTKSVGRSGFLDKVE